MYHILPHRFGCYEARFRLPSTRCSIQVVDMRNPYSESKKHQQTSREVAEGEKANSKSHCNGPFKSNFKLAPKLDLNVNRAPVCKRCIAWLEVMRLRGLSSHDTLGLAVQILSSSLCGCNRQVCSLVPPMPVRCGLQPQLALAIFSNFRGPSSAEPAVPRKVFLWTSYFRSCNRCVGMTSGGGGSLVSGRLWLRLIQALYTA